MATENARAQAQPRTRASKQERRQQLIEATLNVIERKSLNALTLADVADEAGLSRGIVNFHFESKDKLLFEALSYLSREYDENLRIELDLAGTGFAQRMRTLITADLADAICTPRKLAAWFGFFGEAANRPDYLELCWARDDPYLALLEEICAGLDREAGYALDAAQVAMAIYAMQEGLWLRLMLGNAELKREDALSVALGMLGTLFPRHFSASGDILDRD